MSANLILYIKQRGTGELTSSDEAFEAKLSFLMSVLFVHLHFQLISLVYQGGDVVGHLHPLERP